MFWSILKDSNMQDTFKKWLLVSSCFVLLYMCYYNMKKLFIWSMHSPLITKSSYIWISVVTIVLSLTSREKVNRTLLMDWDKSLFLYSQLELFLCISICLLLVQLEVPVSPAELVEILQRTLEEQGVAFGSDRAKKEEKILADRRLREEQDAAYLAALQIDRVCVPLNSSHFNY